jgi:hypothetical protein
MTRPTPRRKSVLGVALSLLTFSLGVTVAVLVGGAAAASSPLPGSTSSSTSSTSSTSTTSTSMYGMDPNSPGAQFLVINATVNAASDHQVVGSSAFPNFTTGAVDNYYTMAHSHVDNSPFAEGTASPADTGPIGQTAAAGNFQQSQYADARWPGGPDHATYGTEGSPYATATADEFKSTADASEASRALNGPALSMPKGFDLRLEQVLAAWDATWLSRLGVQKPAPPSAPTPSVTPTVPNAGVTVPNVGVTTPVTTVTPPLSGTSSPAPSAPVPSPNTVTTPPRSLSSTSTSGDRLTLLTSSTDAKLIPGPDKPKTATTTTSTTTTTKTGKTTTGPTKTYALVTSGESSLGRVSLGGGQIVIHGIHVTASITNDGTPTYKAAVSVASATIGGVPVTIDEDGVHVAGQGGGLPYGQASDALNSALKQAGIQIFLVAPEVTKCNQSGMGTGTPPSSQSGGGTTPSCDQSGGMCDQSGTGTGTTTTTTTTTSSNQSGTSGSPPPCGGQAGATGTCDQTGSGTSSGTGGSTGPGGVPGIGTTTTGSTTTTTSTTQQSGTTTTPSSCGQTGTAPTTGFCSKPGKAAGGTTTTSYPQSGTTGTTSSFDQMSPGMGTSNAEEETVRATGVHLVFTQPVSPPGAPAQFVEHILGEVTVDSLVVPGTPLTGLGGLGFSPSSSSSSSASGSSCLGAAGSSGASAAGGSSVAGGSSALSPSASGSAFGSSSQGSSGSGLTAGSVPAAFAAALKKPVWLLVTYLLWQALVIGTGVSLWNWRRGGAS